MLLQTTETYKFGQKNIIPYAGEVAISKTGFIEVNDELAEKIVAANIGFNYPSSEEGIKVETEKGKEGSEDLSKKADENNPLGGTEDDELNKSNDSAADSSAALIAALDGLSLTDLKLQAQAFPTAEWNKLNKADLLVYLKEKIVAAATIKTAE